VHAHTPTHTYTRSQTYGKYFASLAKSVQSELAAANSVADEVLSSMTTVKAHAAQDSAFAAYSQKLERWGACAHCCCCFCCCRCLPQHAGQVEHNIAVEPHNSSSIHPPSSSPLNHRFFELLIREAVVYALYMCINTFLPAFVSAVVLLYGGSLVLAGEQVMAEHHHQ